MKFELVKKLQERRGESIAEVLIALLISTLALMMLAGMISATQKIVSTSDTKLNDYYKINGGIANRRDSDTLTDGSSYTITLTDGSSYTINGPSDKISIVQSGTSTITRTVETYKNDIIAGKPVIAYYKTAAGG